MDLGRTIRLARKQLKLSQSEVATRAGVGLATVQNIENNRANPEFKTLAELFKVLHIKMTLETKPVELDWTALAGLGCPITVDKSKTFTPSRNRLLDELINLNPAKLKGRESKAVAAFLHALNDHYPSTWRELPMAVRAWAQNQPSLPKLRRIALARLGEYL